MLLHDLIDIPLENLHTAFTSAFSDYAVNMRMPFARFCDMLKRNGFDPAASVGAFDGDRLVGFVLCAQRQYHGVLSLYDCGTGVVPEYRNQRIGARMLTAIMGRTNAKRFILEVLQDNAAAVALYERLGFLRTRDLICLQCDVSRIKADAGMPVTLLDTLPSVLLAQTRGSWSYPPTWQNSTATVLQAEQEHVCAVVADGAFLLGYAILHRESGSLSQIAVHPDYRGQRIGTTLVYALSTICQSPYLYAINVDARNANLRSALDAWGFREYVWQHEMSLTLP